MKILIKGMIFSLVLFVIGLVFSPTLKLAVFPDLDDTGLIQQAWNQRNSNVLVEVKARVVRIHPDIVDFETFQAFTVELDSGMTVRVHHNIDLAPRVPVSANAEIRLRGEYDWNPEGGLIHWTHNAENSERKGGWIEVNGRRFL
ncbi:DUF3465 domain-containing protein [Marinihelvus fidelis]|uniref:DUF3465 domain-containing protein n=1 Tax=Marinihelvus fidelis TaxID=2613842 RepID=A0A5N0T4L4_9GAMM|nr:DUF3465 domain-containing protein [Marinihelvus fidelis]KAA9129791.1 DUF3465 domain-containing protein [Marinihelvus fidelis]